MGDLVDYLRDKLAHADAGCTCPTEKRLAGYRPGVLIIANCVEHGIVQRHGTYGQQPMGRRRRR